MGWNGITDLWPVTFAYEVSWKYGEAYMFGQT